MGIADLGPVAWRSGAARWIALLALGAGLIERIGWAVLRHEPFATGEAARVAVALAEGRGFADAFAVGQGPTAHLLPLSPMAAASVYRLFGVHSAASEALLILWALALTFGCYILFAKIFERLASPPAAVLGGFVLLCLMPTYTGIEVFDFRIWEGALGLAIGGALLALVVAGEGGVHPRRLTLWLGALPALAFFISPPIGLAAMAASGLFLWRRRGRVRAAGVVLSGLLTLAALVIPWTARNALVMGHPIWLRDNLGLELAVANHPGAVGAADPKRVFDDRLAAIHPFVGPAPYRAMEQAGGEIAYAKARGHEAVRWMAAHPASVARLWLGHVREMVFTRPWLFQTAHGVWLPVARSALVAILAVLAIGGLLLAWARRDGRYAYAALYVALPIACYIPFQPINRYTWLLYPALAYLAADAIARLAALSRGRARPA